MTKARSLGGEDPLEKGKATHSSVLAWTAHGQRSLAGYTHTHTHARTHAHARTHTQLQPRALSPVSQPKSKSDWGYKKPRGA